MVEDRAVPSVEVIHCLVWDASMFKHAPIDAFVGVRVSAAQCGGGLAVSSAPVQLAINLWQPSSVSVLPFQKFLADHMLFPQQHESGISCHK